MIRTLAKAGEGCNFWFGEKKFARTLLGQGERFGVDGHSVSTYKYDGNLAPDFLSKSQGHGPR